MYTHFTRLANSCSNAFNAKRLSPKIRRLSKMPFSPLRFAARYDFSRICEQDPRLQPRPGALTDPCQFELLFLSHVIFPICGAFADRKSNRAL